MDADVAVLDKIKKLLNKANSTDSEAEAEALMSKVQDMLLQHGLTMAKLNEHEVAGRNETGEIYIALDLLTNKKEGDWAKFLIFGIAKFNLCHGLHSSNYPFKGEGTMIIIGKEYNQASCQAMVDWLIPTVRRLSRKAFKEPGVVDKWGKFNRAFMMGCTLRLRERMTEILAEKEAAANDVRALVLSNDAHIKTFMEKHHPRVGNSKGPRVNERSQGFGKGVRAAEGIGLNKGVQGGGSSTKGHLN